MALLKSPRFIAFCIIIMIVLGWMGYDRFFKREMESIRIAFAGPMSGEGAAAGEMMSQSIQLYLDFVNKKGGINGRQVVMDTFDDKNDCSKTAKDVALQIAEKNRHMAVIGHWYSSCSINAGEIYKQYEIPAMTPGSVNVKVTQGNEWYFRNIYNASASGQFLANYVNKVFQRNTVSIIHEDAAYGSYIAHVFEETSLKLGMEVKNNWVYKVDDKALDDRLQQIVQELKAKQDAGEDAGAILLAVQAVEGVKLVKLIKDAGLNNILMGESSFSEQTFQRGFDSFPRERVNPGYYTDGIYVATPLIFDTANDKAQQFKEEYKTLYQKEPDWSAAYAYDTIMVIIEAMKNASIRGDHDLIKSDRKKLRESMAAMINPSEAIEGVTGFNYFDDTRDAQKPVALGVYRDRNIVSALTQLQVIRNPNEVFDLDGAVKKGTVIVINGKHMYKTNVVYTGIEINQISDLDFKDLTYTLDFKLWFRFQGDIKPQDIEFSNAVVSPTKPIRLGNAHVETTTNDGITYRLYRVKGKFKTDFLPNHHTFKQHTLGISFRHHDLTRNNLVYVTDVLGMGLTKDVKPNDNKATDIVKDVLGITGASKLGEGKDEKADLKGIDLLVEKLRKPQVFTPISGWSVNHAWFFQDIAKKSSWGDPRYFNIPGGIIEYSQFNAGILIKKDEFALNTILPRKYMGTVLAISICSLFLLYIARNSQRFKFLAKPIWFLQVIFTFSLLTSSEVVLVDWLLDEQSSVANLEAVIMTFNILWWFIPAALLHVAAESFIWTPVEEKTRRVIPNIVRLFLAFIIYFLASVGIVAFVFDQQLTSILATSGVIAMIIGLAIQINISNIFSGIAINVERPFRIGDWVKIGNFEEGVVVDITWRSTRIKIRGENVLSIPNSVASESPILNFCYPTDVFWLWPVVYVDEMHSPDRVSKILSDAVLSSEKVLRDPKPDILFAGIDDRGAIYWVMFAANDYGKKFYILEDVWTRIWFHLNRAGIKPAIQRQEIHMFRGVKERGEAATEPITLLQEVDIFRPLSEKAKLYLSQRMRRHRFTTGEVIVKQGDSGDSLFIIFEGVVSVQVQSDNGKTTEVARLGAGTFFGEMALLTGADRTATVVAIAETSVFEVTKADMAPLIARQPEVSTLFSKVLTQRQMKTSFQVSLMHSQDDVRIEVENTLSERILHQIQNFFGLKNAD